VIDPFMIGGAAALVAMATEAWQAARSGKCGEGPGGCIPNDVEELHALAGKR
jgi:hypothetical protein